jgi:hypothetical protein
VTFVDARQLLDAGPDGYVAARDADVRRRRAEHDRDGAGVVKALGKPSLALWAVLAAAHDAQLARQAVTTTGALADTQGAAVRGKGAEQIAAAAAARRRALDAMTDAAVATLAAHGKTVTVSHRAEISNIVDRVSRHPELLDVWVDGTLREVPADIGFDAFAAITPAPRARTEPAAAVAPPSASRSSRRTEPDVPSPAAERQRAKADAARAKARAAVGEAEHEMADAERAVRDAQRTLASAERARDAAARTLETARRALAKAKG